MKLEIHSIITETF